MPARNRHEPFLATPKGVFIMGIALGAAAVLALLFARQAYRAHEPDTAPAAMMKSVPPVGGGDHVRGGGAVTVIEYSDFQCEYCRQFHATMKKIMAKNAGGVRWVLRHQPLSDVHPHALKLAEAAECAGEQGKFWEMADHLFEQETVNASGADEYAEGAGVRDAGRFRECLGSGRYADRVLSQAADAAATGAEGTPFSLIVGPGGTREIPGALPLASVQALIDAVSLR